MGTLKTVLFTVVITVATLTVAARVTPIRRVVGL